MTLLLLAASLVGITTAIATPAQAYATTTTTAWPSNLSIYSSAPITAHGDGSVTLGASSCSGTGTAIDVTLNADHSLNGTVTDGTGTYQDCPYNGQLVGDTDQTIYYVSTSSVNDWHKTQTIHAVKGNVSLWTYTTSACAVTKGLTLGFDGNLYLLERTGCSTSTWNLISLSSATGKTRFSTSISSSVDGAITKPVMPYDGGVAVVFPNNIVQYFGTDGTTAAANFAPTVATGTTTSSAAITADGRVYLITTTYIGASNSYAYTVYYRDLTSSTVMTLTTPGSVSPSYLYSTPSDGVVLVWATSGTSYFGVFDSSGSLVYSHPYPTVAASTYPFFTVDAAGDVLVQHTVVLANNDRDVILESYDTSGVKTTLFDSIQQFGTSGLDVFSSVGHGGTPQLGGGQYYMALCYRTSYPTVYTSYPTCNQSTDNPQLISIAVPGSDYPRSAVFDGLSSQPSDVALGDSYTAGEANPPFMEGTDNNGGDGCDRSLTGWPVTLAAANGMRLNFRACSGATTADITSTFKTEPAQTDSLSSSTQVVTITIGGNDALFTDFATKCIVGTCDSGSLEYQNSMEAITYVLPSALDSLFATIASDAPNAQIYVVGYPRVAPPAGTSCSFFTDSEKAAANDVVDGLNTDLGNAASSAGGQFTFVDPTASGSPFIGHELCMSDPYFFGLNIAETKFSFHPNPEGMDAYQILLAYALAS
jgi:hypothetical protein